MEREDAIFNLIEKLAIEMRNGLEEVRTEMRSGFKEVRTEMRSGFKEVKEHQIIMENAMKENFDALYDGYKQVSENITQMKETIENISNKLEKHDVEIRVIKAAR